MISMASLESMLLAESEMAAAWSNMTPKERVAHLKAHPNSRFRTGGTHGTEHVDFKSTLAKTGWTKSGRHTYTHKNGRTLQFHPSSKTHRHIFTITHKNGDVTHHRTNRNTRASWLIGKYAKGSGRTKNLTGQKHRIAKPAQTTLPPHKIVAPPPAQAPAKPSLLKRIFSKAPAAPAKHVELTFAPAPAKRAAKAPAAPAPVKRKASAPAPAPEKAPAKKKAGVTRDASW